MRGTSDIRLIGRLLRDALPFWPLVGATFLLELAAMPLALLTPLPVMIAVDSVIGGKPLPSFATAITPDAVAHSSPSLLVWVVFLLFAIALLAQTQKAACGYLKTYTAEKLVLRFRSMLMEQAQRLSFAYHDTRGTGDSVYRIQYDAPAIEWVVMHGIAPFATALLTLLGMVFVIAGLDGVLATVALAICPVVVGLMMFFRRQIRHQYGMVKNFEASTLSTLQEILGSLRLVKVFGKEQHEKTRFVTVSTSGLRARLRMLVWDRAFSFSVAITIAIGTATVLFLGVGRVQASVLTLGQLLLVMSYIAQLYEPLAAIANQFPMLQGSLASAERAYALLDALPDVPEDPHAVPLSRSGGDFEFRQVTFAYEGRADVLQDVSLRIPRGASVGILGRTGAGKTTLVNLLMRFYDVRAGSILLDGRDIRTYRIKDLRNQFAMVPQETTLFSRTIGENIAYARSTATKEEIVAAAKAADAHEFITALPKSYETEVGERGLQLSGGQRQRIALARAFLKDAPILVLDEPTSAIDVNTEARIVESMQRLMQGRTTFVIAHRLSTLQHCDLVFRVEDGRLIRVPREALSAAFDKSSDSSMAVPMTSGSPNADGSPAPKRSYA